ncbi:methyltransferase/methylase [Streptomyces olivaceoviridis]|uniref:methyltransferase n=1 Tax=Streptomyces olivaceoviridis TaxID=1921 RepID=UPI0016751FAC|nr:methyltransferase [Streptomyces olivaceoviridis]GGZ27456.1 methyltransferase/methylase [Streptomyces olivaceoviridis]
MERQGTAGQSPHEIIKVATAFWTSKVVLSAVELGVFAEVAKNPATVEELCAALSLKGRGARDFFDILVSVGLLEREDGVYRTSPLSAAYLNPDDPVHDISGYLLYLNSVYPSRTLLSDCLRTGERLNYDHALAAAATGRAAGTAPGARMMPVSADDDTFGEAFATPDQVTGFVRSMTGYSMGAHLALTSAFDWSGVREVVDVGCSEGAFLAHMLRAHPHLRGVGFDLPQVGDRFSAYVETAGVQDRAHLVTGNFFSDPLPTGDVIVMGHVLHDWDLVTKQMLIRKAYDALPSGGRLLVYESLIDDERRVNTTGMVMSLNVSLVSVGGLGYTGAECTSWMTDAGFRETSVSHLDGPEYMVVGVK